MFSNIPLANRVKRKQIDALIASDPSIIVLTRYASYVPDGAGGKIRAAPVTLPAQIGKLIGRSAAVQLPMRVTEDGRSVQPTLLLVVGRSADIKQGDKFPIHGVKYEIVYVHDDRLIRTVCEVILDG